MYYSLKFLWRLKKNVIIMMEHGKITFEKKISKTKFHKIDYYSELTRANSRQLWQTSHNWELLKFSDATIYFCLSSLVKHAGNKNKKKKETNAYINLEAILFFKCKILLSNGLKNYYFFLHTIKTWTFWLKKKLLRKLAMEWKNCWVISLFRKKTK